MEATAVSGQAIVNLVVAVLLDTWIRLVLKDAQTMTIMGRLVVGAGTNIMNGNGEKVGLLKAGVRELFKKCTSSNSMETQPLRHMTEAQHNGICNNTNIIAITEAMKQAEVVGAQQRTNTKRGTQTVGAEAGAHITTRLLDIVLQVQELELGQQERKRVVGSAEVERAKLLLVENANGK